MQSCYVSTTNVSTRVHEVMVYEGRVLSLEMNMGWLYTV